jgi:hypothetical protein
LLSLVLFVKHTRFENLGLKKYEVDKLFVRDAGKAGWHFDRVTPITLTLSNTDTMEAPAQYSIFCLVEKGFPTEQLKRILMTLRADMAVKLLHGDSPMDALNEDFCKIGTGWYDRVRKVICKSEHVQHYYRYSRCLRE